MIGCIFCLWVDGSIPGGGGELYKRLVTVYPGSSPNEMHCPYDSHHKVS